MWLGKHSPGLGWRVEGRELQVLIVILVYTRPIGFIATRYQVIQ